jgi:hypothetical protein
VDDGFPRSGAAVAAGGVPGAPIACVARMHPATPDLPAGPDPAAPPERPPMQPDTVPTGVPPERPFSPSTPDVWPGAPPESPTPGLPPEVGPSIAPVEVPPLGPSARGVASAVRPPGSSRPRSGRP